MGRSEVENPREQFELKRIHATYMPEPVREQNLKIVLNGISFELETHERAITSVSPKKLFHLLEQAQSEIRPLSYSDSSEQLLGTYAVLASTAYALWNGKNRDPFSNESKMDFSSAQLELFKLTAAKLGEFRSGSEETKLLLTSLGVMTARLLAKNGDSIRLAEIYSALQIAGFRSLIPELKKVIDQETLRRNGLTAAFSNLLADPYVPAQRRPIENERILAGSAIGVVGLLLSANPVTFPSVIAALLAGGAWGYAFTELVDTLRSVPLRIQAGLKGFVDHRSSVNQSTAR